MCSLLTREAHITRRSRHHARSAHHVPRAEHIVPKTKKQSNGLLSFLVAEVGMSCPLENIVASGAYAVARFRCSLFSPLSRSLHLAPRALTLQAHDILRRSWKGKAHRSKRKSRCIASAFSFVLYSLNRCLQNNLPISHIIKATTRARTPNEIK